MPCGSPKHRTHIQGRASAVASNGATATAIYTKDICVAPCSFEIDAGLVELYAKGAGKVARAEQLQFNPGETHLNVDPGSMPLWYTGTLMWRAGAILGGVGAVLLVIDQDQEMGPMAAWAGMTAGGAALFGGGLALSISNKGKWTIVSSPAPSTAPVRL